MLGTLAPIFVLLAPLVHALAVVTPNAQTVWDMNGGRNVIQWSLIPLTSPAPSSQYFDIYIRNGLASVYPNFLNASIGQNLDASSTIFAVAFPLTPGQLLAGSGYQIYFTDPNNANTYYAQSDVFSIAPAQNAASSSDAATSSLAVSSVASSAISALVSSSTGGRFPTAGIPVVTSSSTMSPSSTTASPTGDAAIHAATNPGGPAEQGFGLGFSDAERIGAGAWRVSFAVLGVGAGALLLL